MSDLKACTVCFSTDTKLYNLNNAKLRCEYNLVSGLQTQPGNGLPEFLCVICSTFVKRSIKFRDQCQQAHYILLDILHRSNEINKSQLQSFGKKELGIMPPLSYLDLNRTHYEDIKFQRVHHSKLMITGVTIPIAHYSILNNPNTFCEIEIKNNLNPESNVKIESDGIQGSISKNILKEENCVDQPNTNMDQIGSDDYFDDNHDDGNEIVVESNDNAKPCKRETKVNGSETEEEYANIYPISMMEAKAVLEVYKLFRNGKYKCQVCSKGYHNEERLNIHSRMHDKHTSGNYKCTLCDSYYKTDSLLQTHMTEKHIYKYICKKCPEVSFDKISAQQHYLSTHLQKGQKANGCEPRPTWLSGRGGKRVKGVVTLRPFKKVKKLPDDFLMYSPIRQEEQYQLINDRRKTRNYIDSVYKCELCYRGFRESTTYEKHMKKHDPAYAGKFQCDMCKVCFRDLQKLSKHMKITHLFKYSCQLCSYVCVNREQALSHYKWHKNVTYSCPHCEKIFKNTSTRLTHIRMKHPSTSICNLCGHSFISDKGLYNHKQIAHTAEERELSESAPSDPTDPCYCVDCGLHFLNDHAFVTHLGSSSKHASTNISSKPSHKKELSSTSDKGNKKKQGRQRSSILNKGISISSNCEVCGVVLVNDVQARKHYESEHPGTEYLKRYMCDVCGHVSKQHAHLLVHMRSHTKEKPYECPHCDRRFSMSSSRDRHLVVHTGEKRFECQHCNRRFTQSNTVKLHIQTVHHKIPYAPWVKKNRKNRKELEGTSAPIRALTTSQPGTDTPNKLLLHTQGDYLNAYINHNDH